MEEAREIKRDEKTLSFEERLRTKKQAGYDHFNSRTKLSERRDAQKVYETKKRAKKNKKEPSQRYSKLPVSTIRVDKHREKQASGYERGQWTAHKDFARDPRFDSSSGHLNQGLFASSYGFIKEYQDERYTTLKDSLKEVKKSGDLDQIAQIKQMLQEERQFSMKQKNDRQAKKDKDVLKA